MKRLSLTLMLALLLAGKAVAQLGLSTNQVRELWGAPGTNLDFVDLVIWDYHKFDLKVTVTFGMGKCFDVTFECTGSRSNLTEAECLELARVACPQVEWGPSRKEQGMTIWAARPPGTETMAYGLDAGGPMSLEVSSTRHLTKQISLAAGTGGKDGPESAPGALEAVDAPPPETNHATLIELNGKVHADVRVTRMAADGLTWFSNDPKDGAGGFIKFTNLTEAVQKQFHYRPVTPGADAASLASSQAPSLGQTIAQIEIRYGKPTGYRKGSGGVIAYYPDGDMARQVVFYDGVCVAEYYTGQAGHPHFTDEEFRAYCRQVTGREDWKILSGPAGDFWMSGENYHASRIPGKTDTLMICGDVYKKFLDSDKVLADP